MSIVSRINQFLKLNGITSSQFADSCDIPRPSVSQMLNGRNKKISSDVVSRIHATYPALNISWLMFGEGDMMVNSNIKISDDQTHSKINFNGTDNIVTEDIMPRLEFANDINESAPENFASEVTALNHEQSPLMALDSTLKREQNAPRTRISSNPGFSKSIVNIIVVYDDDSCDLLTPSAANK